jgi:apolipoprotein N-acyltransferase
LLIASFPPLNATALAWLCLAPFLYVLRKSTLTVAALYGYLFGCLFGAGSFFWANSVAPVSIINFIMWLLAFGSYFLIFGVLYKWLSKTAQPLLIISAPSLWVALEFIRSNLSFLSWPWNLLGHTQHTFLSIIQIVNITGVYGISFLIIMMNQVLSELPELFHKYHSGIYANDLNSVRKRVLAHSVLVLFVLLFTFIYGKQQLSMPPSNTHIRIALIQANTLTEEDMNYREKMAHMKKYKTLTLRATHENPDLIIWPASSLPEPITSRLVRFTVRRIAYESGTYLLVGGAGNEKTKPAKEGFNGYSNSEFLISPMGFIEGQYNKIRLLPFNEYIPLKDTIRWPQWITTLQTSFIPGDTFTLFKVSDALFGAPICWENMFPDLFRQFVLRGAQFMVSATNEGFFGNTSAPYQSLAMNVFRAVENRIVIARANTTGISCFINWDGEVIDRINDENGRDLFVSGYLVRNIPLSNTMTFYTKYGDIFAYVTIVLTILSIFFAFFSMKKRIVQRDKRK